MNSPRNTVLLEAHGVGRRPPGVERWLLEDVSLRVSAGDRLAVVGPSGAGKTLLLRALALLDPIQTGEVVWQGRPVRREMVPAFRCQTIYLHQKPALAAETVEAGLRQPYRLAAHREKRFDRNRSVAILERLGRTAAFLDAKVRDLSGGESQIAALVRAVQLDPVLLLLDEPTASLDAQTALAAEQMLDDWINQAAGHRALVWVSHNAQQAQRVSNRVLRMETGRLEGPSQEDTHDHRRE